MNVNMYPEDSGSFRAVSFENIEELTKVLRKANKNCKKYNCKTKIEIILPIKSDKLKLLKCIYKSKEIHL